MVAEVKTDNARSTPAFLKVWLARLGPFVGLILVIAIFALLTESPARYLSPFNLRIVLAQTVIVALGAIGMTMIIVSGGIDLSVGSVIALASVVTALGLRAGWPPAMAVIAGVCVGGLVGLINGLIITGLRVVPFIATLGMLGIARGMSKWIAGQQTVNVPQTWVNELAVTFPTPSWIMLAPGVWVALVLAVLTAVVLRNTVFGRRVFALGSNELAARACGIPVRRLKLWIYSLAGLYFGLAGVMQMSRLRQGDPDRGGRRRTRHHRGGGHRRRQPIRRRGQHPGLDDRRADHGVSAQRLPADGLAQLYSGNHHRRDHRDRRRY